MLYTSERSRTYAEGYRFGEKKCKKGGDNFRIYMFNLHCNIHIYYTPMRYPVQMQRGIKFGEKKLLKVREAKTVVFASKHLSHM